MRIGVDLGGTKIEAVALDGAGTVRARRRIATPGGDYTATLRAIGRLVAEIEAEIGGRASVGVGLPGALSTATGRVKNANSTCLIGQPLEADLAALLERPVRLANDANCFALSETLEGAGKGAASVFGVILGTGVGGGLVLGGEVLTGRNAIAGEWGHNSLPWPKPNEIPGPPCYCGQRGCVETFLSGAGLVGALEDAGGAGGEAGGGQEGPSARQIARRAAEGEPTARRAVEIYAERLSRALAAVINILDPEVIVLGGGLSNMEALYALVPSQWGKWVFSDRVETRLAANELGDSSGVRGAARLWPEEPAPEDPTQIGPRPGGGPR